MNAQRQPEQLHTQINEKNEIIYAYGSKGLRQIYLAIFRMQISHTSNLQGMVLILLKQD